jgi:hypothetical protein
MLKTVGARPSRGRNETHEAGKSYEVKDEIAKAWVSVGLCEFDEAIDEPLEVKVGIPLAFAIPAVKLAEKKRKGKVSHAHRIR